MTARQYAHRIKVAEVADIQEEVVEDIQEEGAEEDIQEEEVEEDIQEEVVEDIQEVEEDILQEEGVINKENINIDSSKWLTYVIVLIVFLIRKTKLFAEVCRYNLSDYVHFIGIY